MSEVVEAYMSRDDDGFIVGRFYSQAGCSFEVRFRDRAHADLYIEELEPEIVNWEPMQ